MYGLNTDHGEFQDQFLIRQTRGKRPGTCASVWTAFGDLPWSSLQLTGKSWSTYCWPLSYVTFHVKTQILTIGPKLRLKGQDSYGMTSLDLLSHTRKAPSTKSGLATSTLVRRKIRTAIGCPQRASCMWELEQVNSGVWECAESSGFPAPPYASN